jgi:hypothetical protein
MSLLDDLRAIDVRRIVDARGSLSASVNTTDVQAITSSGNSVALLGDLGRSLQSIQDEFPSPEALLEPLVTALGNLAPQLDSQRVPIAPYLEAVREGATLVSRVLGGFDGNPADWGRSSNHALGDALQFVGGRANELGARLGRSADGHARILALVEHPPTGPHEIAELVLELAVPYQRRDLVSLRDGTRALMEAASAINFPTGRTSGLIAAFDLVATTAATRDPVKLDAALRELDRARRQTIATLQDDLRFIGEQVDRLRVAQVLSPLADVSRTIRAGRDGVIEFMRDFGRELGEMRFQIENLDVERVRTFLQKLPDMVEREARARVEAPVDQLVARTKETLRDFLRRLPIRQYRAEVSRFLHEVAERIENAGLDGPANAARGALADAQRFLTSNSIAADIQAEMQRLNATIEEALDRIEAPLNTIAAEVDAVADRAVDVLNRAAEALAAFQAAIDSLHDAIERLGVHEAEKQVVDALQDLRQKAEDLLSKVPLPEQIRPQVEQLTETLRNIDFDELMQPVREAAESIEIPAEVAEAVNGGLDEARRVIENLIPQQLIDSINEEVGNALASIRGFDPIKLVPDLSAYLEQAASAVEKLDPRPVAESVRGPYQTVLDFIDGAHPLRLLEPVINAYDSLMDAVPVPNPATVARSVGETLDAAGRVAGRALVEPATRLTPEAGGEVGDPAKPQPIEIPPGVENIRPGDVIRLLGYLPGKLREALAAIEAGAIGDVMREIDSCSAGLARQLRAVPDALAGIEARVDRGLEGLLAPVAAAQARAQLAIHANVEAGGIELRLDAVASAGPVSLRRDLAPVLGSARRTLRAAANGGGNVRLAFESTAAALESSPLSTLAGNIDDLLLVLDPEPLAREMDLIMTTLLQKAGPLLQVIRGDLEAALQRVRAIVSELNPMALAQRFLSVLEVLRDEVEVLNPRRLAIELAEIHAAIREVIEAYDPRLIAQDLFRLSREVAQQIRALNPAGLLGNVDFWQTAVDRVAQLNPATRLQEVGAALRPVGEKLAAIDVEQLIEDVNRLSPLLLESFEQMIEGIRNEIVALLESLRFATGSASASASVSVG